LSYERANLTQVPEDAVLPPEVRVFVNERGISLPRGATVQDAVDASSEKDGAALAAGRARVTDSRGLPLPADAVVTGGAIMRVLPVREHQPAESE
jgi:hypothetical protein